MDNRIIPAILTLLLVTVPFAPLVQGAGEATDDQTDAIEAAIAAGGGNSGPKGQNTLQGDWSVYNEILTLNMHGENDHGECPYGAVPCVSFEPFRSGNSENGEFQLLYDPVFAASGECPPVSSCGDIDLNYGELVSDVTVFRLEATLYLAANAPFSADVQLIVDGSPVGDAARVVANRDPLTTTLPGFGAPPPLSALPSTGFADFATPVTVAAGSELQVRVSAVVPLGSQGGSLELWYGKVESAQSRINIFANSARINAWTESTQGATTTTFPLAQNAPAEGRTVRFQLAHVSPFADHAVDRGTLHHIRVVDEAGTVYYSNGNPGSVDAAQPWGAFRDPQNVVEAGATRGVEGIGFYPYALTYPADFAGSGTFKIQVQASGPTRAQNWLDVTSIVLGGTGVDVALTPFEDATKDVLLGERTSFLLRVTNNGASTDSIVLSVATPGNNWQATLATALLQDVAAGESRDVRLDVTPAPGALAGASKAIPVTATSVRGGETDTQTVTVVMTTDRTKGISLLTETAAPQVAPGQTRTLPIVVKNEGNAADRFVVTTSGAPLGWKVLVQPSTMELSAKSQNSILLQITAPVDAPRGASFTLDVLGVSVEDNLIRKVLHVPVQVFLQDKFEFQLFGGTDAQGNVIPHGPTGNAARYVVSLRDEGPDGNVNENCEPLGTGACANSLLNSRSSKWDADQDPDRDFDTSAVFRFMLVNGGDRQDTIRFIPTWINEAGIDFTGANADFCDDPGDNIRGPDGFRIVFWDPATESRPAFPSAKQSPGAVTSTFEAFYDVPARSTKYVYGAVEWHHPAEGGTSTCPTSVQQSSSVTTGARANDAAPRAPFRVEAISQNDPSQRATHFLQAVPDYNAGQTRILSQKYSDQTNQVHIQLEANSLGAKTVQNVGNAAARTTTYDLRVINAGNEMDTLRVSLPQGADGWTYAVTNIDDSLTFDNAIGFAHGAGGRASGCSAPTTSNQEIIFRCTMGAFDEASFQVQVTAPVGQVVGLVDRLPVRVESEDSYTDSTGVFVQDRLTLRTTVTGSFLYNLLPDPPAGTLNVDIYANGTRSIPFTIKNLGTSEDTFLVDLIKAPAAASGWTGTFSSASPVFVPAGRDLHGFLTVKAPVDAQTGDEENYRIRVQSLDSPLETVRILDVVAQVVDEPASFNLVGDPAEILGLPGTDVDVQAQAVRLTGTGGNATFRIDETALPAGWAISTLNPSTDPADEFDGDGVARYGWTLGIPDDAIGGSRVAIPVTATYGGQDRFTTLVVSMAASSFGLLLDAPEVTDETVLVAPGDTVDVDLTVRNLGVGLDTAELEIPGIPTGWTVTFSEDRVPLQALQTVPVTMSVTAPADMAAGHTVPLVLEATSTGDASVKSVLPLNFTAGDSAYEFISKSGDTVFGLPEETVKFVVTVGNNGTLPDTMNIQANLTGAYKDIVSARVSPAQVTLGPGEAADLQVEVDVPKGFLPKTRIGIPLEASSTSAFLGTFGTNTVTVEILDHKVADVDGDGIDEYAVDRNRNPNDGYEGFREAHPDEGIRTTLVNMERFLSDAGRAAKVVMVTLEGGTTVEEFQYVIDGDEDGRVDLFLDSTGDGLPNIYWDPDRGWSHTLDVQKDVTRDGVLDYFLDVDGDSRLDRWFDITVGEWNCLIAIDRGSGMVNYVVDLDGDCEPDIDEPVLVTQGGIVVRITERLDITGDGQLDFVIDEDGDGIPDCFIPAGKQECIPIVMEDVTGDGIDDWTYDADGDGKRDSYYDPVTGKSGLIDTRSQFVQGLVDYWFVPAIFGVVLVLFVVLMLVTRRG